MGWSIRHQGSPRIVGDLTAAAIAEGLQDGQWEPGDEVKGPGELHWQAVEQHPRFAELVDDLDEPGLQSAAANEHLDMNPLIDVCLVLLVFFILSTTVQALHKVLAMPDNVRADQRVPRVVPDAELDRVIRVSAVREGGRDVIKLGEREVAEVSLRRELMRAAREQDRTRDRVLIDARGVQWGTVVKIIDAAGGANIRRVMLQTPPSRPAPGRFL